MKKEVGILHNLCSLLTVHIDYTIFTSTQLKQQLKYNLNITNLH